MKTLALRTAIILSIGLVALALWQMREAAQLLGIALALAAGLAPLVDRVADRGIPRTVAAAIVFIALMLLLVGSLVGLGTLAAADLGYLAERLPLWYSGLQRAMSFSSGWLGQIGRALPADALSANQIDDPKAIGDALMGLITGGAVAAALTLSIASLGFYWLAEQQRIERLWLSLLPLGARTQARAIWREVYHEIGVYVRGEAVIVALTTVALLMIFNALHVPGASILAITGGLAQVVPIIGPPLAVLPGTLAALAQGQASAAIALAGAVCALLVIRLLVAPRIFRAGINPNPVLVIVLILALFQAGGVVLMLLAPPLAAAIHTTTRILADNERAKASAPRPGEIASLHTNLDDIAAKIAVDHPDARRIQDMIERARRLVDQAGSVS